MLVQRLGRLVRRPSSKRVGLRLAPLAARLPVWHRVSASQVAAFSALSAETPTRSPWYARFALGASLTLGLFAADACTVTAKADDGHDADDNDDAVASNVEAFSRLVKVLASVTLEVAPDTVQRAFKVFQKLEGAHRGGVLNVLTAGEDFYLFPQLLEPVSYGVASVGATVKLLKELPAGEQVEKATLMALVRALKKTERAVKEQRFSVAEDWTLDKILRLTKQADEDGVVQRLNEAARELAQAEAHLNAELGTRMLVATAELRSTVSTNGYQIQAMLRGVSESQGQAVAALAAVHEGIEAAEKQRVAQARKQISMLSSLGSKQTAMFEFLAQGARREPLQVLHSVEHLRMFIGNRPVYYLAGAGSRLQMEEPEMGLGVARAWSGIASECGISRDTVGEPKAVLLYGGDPFLSKNLDVGAVARDLHERSNGQLAVVAVQVDKYRNSMCNDQWSPKYSHLAGAHFFTSEEDPTSMMPKLRPRFTGYAWTKDVGLEELETGKPRLAGTVSIVSSLAAKLGEQFKGVLMFGGGPATADELHHFWHAKQRVRFFEVPVSQTRLAALSGMTPDERRAQEERRRTSLKRLHALVQLARTEKPSLKRAQATEDDMQSVGPAPILAQVLQASPHNVEFVPVDGQPQHPTSPFLLIGAAAAGALAGVAASRS